MDVKKEIMQNLKAYQSSKKVIFVTDHYVEIPYNQYWTRYEGEIDENADGTKTCTVGGEVAFCPFCNKMEYTTNMVKMREDKRKPDPKKNSIYRLSSTHKHNEYEHDENDNLIMQCPNCGADLTGFEWFFLKKAEKWQYENFKPTYYSIFRKDEDKLVAVVFFSTFYPNTEVGKLAMTRYQARIVFNLKTGQTHKMEIRESDGKKKKPKWVVAEARISNCTYNGDYNFCSCLNACVRDNQFLEDLTLKLLEIHGGKWNGKVIDFKTLTIYNRFPKMGLDFAESIKYALSYSNYDVEKVIRDNKIKKFLLEFFRNEDVSKTIEWLEKRYKIPNKKKIRKLIFTNPLAALDYAAIANLGFTDYNIIIDTLQNVNWGRERNYFGYIGKLEENMRIFITDLIAKRGEVATKDLLFGKNSPSGSTVRDSANMYFTLKTNNIVDESILKGTIIQIHDALTLNYRKLRQQKIVIAYDENLLKLNDVIDEYEFTLAKDTHQLIDVGQEMGICVGSYGTRAAERRLIIVLMTQNGKYVGCLELDSEGKRLVQAKAKFNNLLQEKKAVALKKWVESKKINAKTCWDYSHIAKDEIEYDESKIYQGTHNYAGWGM